MGAGLGAGGHSLSLFACTATGRTCCSGALGALSSVISFNYVALWALTRAFYAVLHSEFFFPENGLMVT